MVNQVITGFHQDADGDWVAELSCGHNQHVRHNPPFMPRPWAVSAAGRAERLGTPLSCPPCERAELPEAIRPVRSSPEWDEHTLPPGLRQAHQLAASTWGKIVVREGALRFSLRFSPPSSQCGESPLSVELGPHTPVQAIPPGVRHEVDPLGHVRFRIDFFTVDRTLDIPRVAGHTEAGDRACWAGLLCPECGAVLTEDPHRDGCSRAGLLRTFSALTLCTPVASGASKADPLHVGRSGNRSGRSGQSPPSPECC